MVSELVWHIHTHTIPAAYALLPGQMTSREATAMVLSIGFQESEFNARRQGGRGIVPGQGPARGFWQFERMGGCAELLTNPVTGPLLRPICKMFLYDPNPTTLHSAIEHNDVLGAVCARLLLWVDPRALPTPLEVEKGWQIYLANWRPGKPHHDKWAGNFTQAWDIVKGV